MYYFGMVNVATDGVGPMLVHHKMENLHTKKIVTDYEHTGCITYLASISLVMTA